MSPRNTNPVPISPLRAARLRQGLSIEQLAVAAGIGRATLFLAEKAPQLMSERTARAVAEVLKVPVSELRPADGGGLT